MTQLKMPPIKRHLDQTKNLFVSKKLERIETSLNPVVVQNLPQLPILNQKMPTVKFKENVIIMGKVMNGNEILVCSRDVKNIFQD
jgi:hypothetical protein